MMTTPDSSPGLELLGGALSLHQDVFQQIATLPNGSTLALVIVLLAGFSLSVGQFIILFINRVKPIRFVFSLILNAILYTFGYLFLVFSTWLICLLPGSVYVSPGTLAKVFGLAYTPLLLSFLGALPYLGYPLLNVLSIWRFLALVVGFSAIAHIGTSAALGYVVLGGIALQFLENTIGQPIAKLGKTLADRVAGVELAQAPSALAAIVQSGTQPASPSVNRAYMALPEVCQLIQAAGRSNPEAAQAVAQAVRTQATSATAAQGTQSVHTADPLMQLEQKTSRIPQRLKLLMGLLAMVLFFIVIATLLRPLRDWLFGWYNTLRMPFRLIFDLVWIGVVATVFAGILAPLETLGWWAGWYGDDVQTDAAAIAPPRSPLSFDNPDRVSRYVIYLDGICQSGEEYTPDVTDFLNALKPTLPEDVELIQGLMMYSVLNKPLDQDRPLAFLWKLADQMRWNNPTALLGILVNLRNVLIVAVSSDKRYGPIYNQGIAQVLYNGLRKHGYQSGSGIPITLIGYSGGGEMSAAAGPYLRRATGASVDVISLGGVMSGNNNFLKLEHLYHIVGEKDSVERIGPLIFPGRWKILPLSYWNRAMRRGKITILSAGPVGHQVPGGYMDPNAYLPDGRTNLQDTIEIILKILKGELLTAKASIPRRPSNYEIYQQSALIQPQTYPARQTVNSNLYQPIGIWMGRLILPKQEERINVKGVLFEVYHTAPGYEHLIGQTVKLRWMDDPILRKFTHAVTQDIHFSAEAEYTSEYGGLIHPTRLNHWQQVGPLESLAGSHPVDDIVVRLEGDVEVESTSGITLRICNTPVQITGRYYALIRFIAPVGTEEFRVVHFNRISRQFDGFEEQMRVPQVMLAAAYGSYPSSTHAIESSPLNEMGWYVYGAKDTSGRFVVQALAPRSLLRLQPDRVIFGSKAGYKYIRQEAWADIVAQKGKISSVLISPQAPSNQAAMDTWQEGDRALVLHTYGGIGGKKREPSAATPIFFGHFAYGLARVIREPLSNELCFDIQYHQVYTHNTDGLTAGTIHWSRYMGDRQLGWVGTRPVCDILIKLDAYTGFFESSNGKRNSALNYMLVQLQVMTARYRTGDGTGGTYVGPANNCSQDSNQALFASLRNMQQVIEATPNLQEWLTQHPDEAVRFHQLVELGKALEHKLQAFGGPRSDWENNEYNLGSTLEDQPFRNLLTGLGSWRTLLPRLASDTITRIFLKQNASVWVLRTNQIGGQDPDIEPIAPITF